MKLLITDYRKRLLLGDVLMLDKNITSQDILGKVLQVKILGLVWITYNKFYYENTI